MSQRSWDMDNDSCSSDGSGRYSRRSTSSIDYAIAREANLKVENIKLRGNMELYEKEMAELKEKYVDTIQGMSNQISQQNQKLLQFEVLQKELQEKTARIGIQNDEIRALKETISNLESRDFSKGSQYDSESEITIDEDVNSDEDSYAEVKAKKNRRKRKSHRGLTLDNKKAKKVSENQMMEEESQHKDDFPPLSGNIQKRKMSSRNDNQNGQNKGKEQRRIPPVILRDKSCYTKLVAEFATRKINFDRATTLPEGVKIIPSSSTDFRNMTKLLDDRKIEYHSYQLPEDKLLHVVLRGVLESFTEEEIMEDLKRQGFSPKKIVRFKYKNGRPMPMVLVLVPKEDKGIYQISEIYYNSVKVEAQRTRTRSTQCYNCQMFGHSAFGCRAKARCVKCAGEHSSKTCSLSKEQNMAKCVNCGGNHPASFGGCPKHPRHLNQQQAAPQRKEFKWGTQENVKLAATPENLGAATNAIKIMNSAMQEFMKNLQKMQSQFASVFMPTSSVGNQE